MEEKYTIILKLKNNETGKDVSMEVAYNKYQELSKLGITTLEIMLGSLFEMEKRGK